MKLPLMGLEPMKIDGLHTIKTCYFDAPILAPTISGCLPIKLQPKTEKIYVIAHYIGLSTIIMNHAKYQWWLSVIAHYIGLSTMNQSIDELKDYVIAHYIGLSTNLIHDFAYEK